MGAGIFAGLKVVDCASFVAAPGAATLMSDFGADVIKLEPPEGDAYRYAYVPPGKPAPEHNFLWMLGSRNKRSLALDLKVPEGLRVLERLLDGADVFITNLPLLTRRRLKIGFEDLSPGRPRLIYASFTAYGESGAEADRPGFDTTGYWARSGLMDLMRPVDGAPISSSGGMGDNPAAVMLYAAILSALYRRERTGLGGQVDVSLLAAGLWTNSLQIQANLCGMPSAPRVRRTEGANACVNTYRCADDRWFNMMVLNEAKLFRPLVAAIGREDLADDPRFAEIAARRANSAALIAIFDERFAAHDLAYWREALNKAGVSYEIVATLDDVRQDAQAHTIGAITPFAHDPDLYTVSSPFNVQGSPKTPPGRAPELGEHSRAILQEIGFDDAEISNLKQSGVIVSQ